MKLILESSLYFLALINPASKIFLLSSMDPPYTWKELRSVALRSNLAALIILAALTGLGSLLLKVVFHVDIYSLKVAGGVVLFIIGLTAVRQGRFYEKRTRDTNSDISIVPLAAPLIAGPGTMAAAIAYSSSYGEVIPALPHPGALHELPVHARFAGHRECPGTGVRHRPAHPHHRAHRRRGGGADDPRRSGGLAAIGAAPLTAAPLRFG
jgi:hypothetical protein